MTFLSTPLYVEALVSVFVAEIPPIGTGWEGAGEAVGSVVGAVVGSAVGAAVGRHGNNSIMRTCPRVIPLSLLIFDPIATTVPSFDKDTASREFVVSSPSIS